MLSWGECNNNMVIIIIIIYFNSFVCVVSHFVHKCFCLFNSMSFLFDLGQILFLASFIFLPSSLLPI
jgi:hypothetical protein